MLHILQYSQMTSQIRKFTFYSSLVGLASVIGFCAYFECIPPPQANLSQRLESLFPEDFNQWEITDQDIAESPESSARISDFLNFDDVINRIYQKENLRIGLYIAYWTPGKASYRWAGAHTPDTCWILNGWTCKLREHSVPFHLADEQLEPSEFGIYSKDGNDEHVYFWHIVGGRSHTYKQMGTPNIFGAINDIQKHGLRLRKEQFFVRLSSNKNIEVLRKEPLFAALMDGLRHLDMQLKND